MTRTPNASITNNDDATTDPTVNDDETQGYDVGSRWINTTGSKVFFASDVTTGAAVWVTTTAPVQSVNGETGVVVLDFSDVGAAPTLHASQHLPDGSDPITTAAPGASSLGSVSAVGTANSLARSDHIHQSNTAPVNVTKAAASIGTSGEPARADHKHDITTAAAVANQPGSSNAEGTATSLARSDHTHQLHPYGTGANTITQGNDTRIPTQDENDALQGTNGAPSNTNRYVTNTDPRNTDARVPTGPAGGDLAGTYANPTVARASQSFALTGVITPTTLGSSQNDYNPTGLSTAAVLRLSASVAVNITGLAGGASGRVLIVHNVGSFDITLISQSASSTAANRFATPSNVIIQPGVSVVLQYDSTASRWRVPGWQAPALLPAPRFFEVTTDISTTSTTFTTMFSGVFSLTASELNLVIVMTCSIENSNADRTMSVRLVLNGTPLKGAGDRTGAANTPICLSVSARGTGVVGSNTLTVEWRTSSSTARCLAATEDDNHASLSIWSSV